MKLFKDKISKDLYKARAVQAGSFISLGLAAAYGTSDVSWMGVTQQSQSLISNIGLAAAIGLTTGTTAISTFTELSEYIDRNKIKKIEQKLGLEAFEIIESEKSITSMLKDEKQLSNTIKVEKNESIEEILDKGIEAKKVSLEDIIPVLNEKVELEEDTKLNTVQDITVEVKKIKNKLPQYVLDKLFDKESELYQSNIKEFTDFEIVIDDEKNDIRKEPKIGSIKDSVEHNQNKIEPTIKTTKETDVLSVKNTEIEMNIKKESTLIDIFNKKKSCKELDVKIKNSIQNKLI